MNTAIHGYSFCKAARSAFFLLLRNILRVAAVNMVSGFVIALGKIMIPSVTAIFAYLAIIYGGNLYLSQPPPGIVTQI
jgi:Plasma-membrane choline transporter